MLPSAGGLCFSFVLFYPWEMKSMSSSDSSSPPDTPRSRRRLPVVVAVLILFVFVAFRAEALLRVQGPLIADSTEYLLLAHDLLTDAEVPVAPVRNCFFSAMVAGQFLLQESLFDSSFGADSGRVLPILFHLLAILGAYRLARQIHSRSSGTLAALIVATLPHFGYWASDCLTDVPAAACIVWAVFFWVRGKPFSSGLLMGIGVLLRYQAIVCLVALLGTALISSRRKEMLRTLLGLLIIPLGLGILDAAYWGEPFLSIREHFSVFVDHLGSSVEKSGGDVAVPESGFFAGLFAMGQGALSKAYHSDFVQRAPEVLSWTLIAAFASYAVVRRWVGDRRAGDAAFIFCALVYLLLSFLTDDDLRYLVSFTPVFAAVGAASAAFWVEKVPSFMARRSPSSSQVIRLAALFILGAAFCGASWIRQRQLLYRPFGAVLDVVETVVSPNSPLSIALSSPWIPAHRYLVRGLDSCEWHTESALDLVNIYGLDELCLPGTGDERGKGRQEALIRDLDDFIVTSWNPRWEEGSRLWRYLNRYTVLDEVRYDPLENEDAAWRFRIVDEPSGDLPFWEVLSEEASGEPLAVFAGGVSLMAIEGSAYPDLPGAVRVDFTWKLDASVTGARLARARVNFRDGPSRPSDQHYVLPPNPTGRVGVAAPGSSVRVTRYYTAPRPKESSELLVAIDLFTLPGTDESEELLRVEVIQSRASTGGEWWIGESVPLEDWIALDRPR
jgi:hypothetical protein